VPSDIKPRGNADTASEYLAAADDGIYLPSIPNRKDDDPARQVAAMQGIGWALLAVCDQLADLADAAADNGGQLADIATAVNGLTAGRPARARGCLTAVFARLVHATARRSAGTVELTAPQAVIVRHAMADAAAWRAWRSEGHQCTGCAALDPGKCTEHAGDEDLAAAYAALRARLPGTDAS
jgi:hypothetical protein